MCFDLFTNHLQRHHVKLLVVGCATNFMWGHVLLLFVLHFLLFWRLTNIHCLPSWCRALNFIWGQGCAVWYIFDPQPCTQVMWALCILKYKHCRAFWNISNDVHAKIVAVRTVMMCTLAQYAIVNPEIYALGTQAAIVALGTVFQNKMCTQPRSKMHAYPVRTMGSLCAWCTNNKCIKYVYYAVLCTLCRVPWTPQRHFAP